MKVRLNRTRWVSLAVAGMLMFSACGAENKTTEAKITSPAANSVLKVGEQIQIEGLVTGAAITKVDIVIDNTTYASLSATDKATGVATFPLESGRIPWTPQAAGPHALQLIVYGAPDDKLLSKSEPVVVQAQTTEVQVTPEATQPPAPTAAAPPAPGATAVGVAPAPGATAAPPAGGNAGGAPSMSVTNDFVNVRKGPGVGYDKLGKLDKGQTAPVKGKSSDGDWLQIAYPAAANGVGWVKQRDGSDTLVQANDAAKSVPVVAAPPLPVQVAVPEQPSQPVQPPVIIPIGPTVPPPGVATAVPLAPLTGSRNVLRVNANPIGAGGTVYASWSIPNFKDGEFDKGDGRGYIPPVQGNMTVDIPGVTVPRQIKLRWHDTAGTLLEDVLTVQVAGVAQVTLPTSQPSADCNSSNPDWRGNSTAAYTFCVKKDLGWTDGGSPTRNYSVNQDVSLTADWNVYGINGIHFVVEPSGQQCGPQGTSVIDKAVNGAGSFAFNVNQLAYGGYIVHLKVTRKDNQVVNYNEKFLCIGNGGGGSTSATATSQAATAIPTTIPENGSASTATPISSDGGGGGGGAATPIP